MKKTLEPSTKPAINYESNPFKVSFGGLNGLFKYNQTWGILILIFGLFGALDKTISNSETSRDSFMSTNNSSFDASAIVMIAVIGLGIVAVALAVSAFVNGILSFVAYKTSKQQAVSFSEPFSVVWSKFPTLYAIQLLVTLKVIGGLLLLLVPGIRAALRYQFAFWPVFDEDADAKTALKRMKELSKGHLMEILGIVFSAAVIPFITPLLLVGGQITAYPQLKALYESKAPKPKVHWLNYALLLVPILLVLLVVLLAVFIFSRVNAPSPEQPARDVAQMLLNVVWLV